MTLPASGPISFANLNAELGRAAGSPISLGDAAVRNLAGAASGAVGMASLRGKSAVSRRVVLALNRGTSSYYGGYLNWTVTFYDWAAFSMSAAQAFSCTLEYLGGVRMQSTQGSYGDGGRWIDTAAYNASTRVLTVQEEGSGGVGSHTVRLRITNSLGTFYSQSFTFSTSSAGFNGSWTLPM